MASLLYLDLLCPPGHLNFNSIWLRALTESNIFDVTVALPAKYEKGLDYNRTLRHYIELPERWFPRIPSGCHFGKRMLLRMHWVWCMWKIFNFLDISKYQLVFVSSFDTPTAFFGPRMPNLVWVGHTLAEQVEKHWLLTLFLKDIGRRSHLAVLGKVPFDCLCKIGFKNIWSFPLGIPKRFSQTDISHPDFSNDIFAPGKSHQDVSLSDVLHSPSVSQALSDSNMTISIRHGTHSSDWIRIVPAHIPLCEYAARMNNSAAILLFYDNSYVRCSSILREAMVANRPILIRRTPLFSHLEGLPGIGFFSDSHELAQRIRELANGRIIPNYSSFLENESPEHLVKALANLTATLLPHNMNKGK